MNIRETVVSAGVSERQPLVIEAEQVKYGGVEVVNVDPVFGHRDAVFVGRAVDDAAFHTATGQPR